MTQQINGSIGLSINNGNLQFQSSNHLGATQVNANGPSPGAILATTGGVNVSFAQLVLPGVCLIKNNDPTNYVTIGLFDGSTFRPFAEVLAGETYLLRFSRTMLTANTAADVLRLVANTATVDVEILCFDA